MNGVCCHDNLGSKHKSTQHPPSFRLTVNVTITFFLFQSSLSLSLIQIITFPLRSLIHSAPRLPLHAHIDFIYPPTRFTINSIFISIIKIIISQNNHVLSTFLVLSLTSVALLTNHCQALVCVFGRSMFLSISSIKSPSRSRDFVLHNFSISRARICGHFSRS